MHTNHLKHNPQGGSLAIIVSFLLALWLSVLPLPSWMNILWPLWIPLVCIFWAIYLPQKVQPWTIALCGIIYDVLTSSYLGEHMFALLVVYFIAATQQRQMKASPWITQMQNMAGLLALYQILIFLLQGTSFKIMWIIAIPWLISLIIWPWVFFLLYRIAVRFYVHSL